jgi:GNAT superfamily N-acetyltransferase
VDIFAGPREQQDDGAVQIRRAVTADAPRIADLHVRGWQAGYRGLLPQSLLDALDPAQRVPRWTATVEQAAWPASGTLVAEDAGDVLGFADLRPTRDADQDPAVVGEITSFYVAPDAWGQGVGRSLMAASIQTMTDAGFSAASLWVLDTNVRAIAFYEAAGWLRDGATKDDVLGGAPIRDLRYRRAIR